MCATTGVHTRPRVGRRRSFSQGTSTITCMRTSFCLIILSIIVPMGAVADDKHPGLTFKIDRTVARHGFDGDTCWVHARAGVVPANVPGNTTNNPIVVMTMQKLLLSGSDVFYALNGMRSKDGGGSWDGPYRHDGFARQKRDGDIEISPIAEIIVYGAVMKRQNTARATGQGRAQFRRREKSRHRTFRRKRCQVPLVDPWRENPNEIGRASCRERV